MRAMPSRIWPCVVFAEAEPWPDSTLENPTPHMPTYKQSCLKMLHSLAHSCGGHAPGAYAEQQGKSACMKERNLCTGHVRTCTDCQLTRQQAMPIMLFLFRLLLRNVTEKIAANSNSAPLNICKQVRVSHA